MPEISEKPWSSYTEADYTLEQWHTACLIHLHDGVPTSKSECKLPVKTPTGTLSRAGVHAAASVLAGGRGGVDAPPEKIAAAKKSLMRLYAQLSEKAPPSMTHFNTVEATLAHYGVPGMKWGIRKRRGRGSSPRPRPYKYNADGTIDIPASKNAKGNVTLYNPRGQEATPEAVGKYMTQLRIKVKGLDSIPNKELQDLITRMNLENNYAKALASSVPQKTKGKKFIDNLLKTEGMPLLQGRRGPMTATGIAVIAAAKTASAGAKYAGKHRS
jgi:hypothetical protein